MLDVAEELYGAARGTENDRRRVGRRICAGGLLLEGDCESMRDPP